MLRVSGVWKSYGSVAALRGVDLDVAAGEVVGLVGPNGAGKTSLVSIVAGLRRPDRGTVVVDGIDVARHPDRVGERIGLAPQELGIYPTISVARNLQLYGELSGLRRAALRQRIDEVAAALDLTDLLDRPGEALSGGQKRRLHTAMALIHQPPLLLLDEPTAGADLDTRGRLLQLVKDLAAGGAAVVYSTHYLPEVEQLEATVAVIDRGQMLARGPLRELLAAHARSAVELIFDGPPPAIEGAAVDGDRVRVPTPDPAATAATILGQLGDAARRLRGVEIVRPTLESVYVEITGRRYDAEGAAVPAPADADEASTRSGAHLAEEETHVVAP